MSRLSVTTFIKPDVEEGGATFRLDTLMTTLMDIIAGEMMLITVEDGKIIIERCDWKVAKECEHVWFGDSDTGMNVCIKCPATQDPHSKPEEK